MCSVVYSEFGYKNHRRLVHQLHLDNKVVTQYTDSSLDVFASLYQLYISKLPDAAKKRDILYCKPKIKVNQDDDIGYYNVPVGHLLSQKFKSMFLDVDAENIQNYS